MDGREGLIKGILGDGGVSFGKFVSNLHPKSDEVYR